MRNVRHFARAAAIPAALVLFAALPRAAAAQHEHHAPPAQPAQPAPAPAPMTDAEAQRRAAEHLAEDRTGGALRDSARTPVPVAVDFAAAGADGVAMERREVVLRMRLTDPATGRPLTGLDPMAWVDVRREEGATGLNACRQRVGAFVESTLMVKHGQINITQPVDDLNGHYLVALARGGRVVVIDPVKGFGRTRMVTAVPLPGEGEDWAATADDKRLFVSIPTTGQVAVINTHTWRVDTVAPAGARPMKVAVHPDGRRLFVVDEGAQPALLVVDTDGMRLAATLPLGAGPHALAFSADGATAFVTSRAAGTVTVVDTRALRKVADVATGREPADVAWSAARRAAFVVNEGDGALAVVDAAGKVVDRAQLAPGIRTVRFAPAPSDEHQGHAGHGGAAAPDAGNLAWVLNPRAGTLQIYNAEQKKVVRTLSGAPEPDQVGFTGSFAYIRAAGTASVALIPLANPLSGAVGPHDYFPAGNEAPGSITRDSLGDVMAPQPGVHDALYVANPTERMVYSYHYMEGMPVPHGGLTTYSFVPRSIRVVSRRVRETEPGVYTATVRLERAGEYDLIFRNTEPYLLGCYGFQVTADPALHTGQDIRVEVAQATHDLKVGRNQVRFRVTDARAGGAVVDGLEDFRVQLASTDGWQQRAPAKAVGGGVYEVEVDVPAEGVYFAAYEIPSRGVRLRDGGSASFRAAP